MDDFYYVVTEEELPQAKRDIRAIGDFLAGYGLRLNLKKTRITEVHKGVKFLGAVATLLAVKDAYPKLLLARTRQPEQNYEGVRIIDIADWLMGE